jgi:hypothetical protein
MQKANMMTKLSAYGRKYNTEEERAAIRPAK